jgi:YfiH family protein
VSGNAAGGLRLVPPRPVVVQPNWPAPAGVQAFCTTRSGGCSEGPWSSLNLGERSGDNPGHVRENRRRLNALLPAPPQWLRQVHGVQVALHPGQPGPELEADALVARGPGQVCAVLAADCLPVLFCDRGGSRVAATHAGWRGLAAGVLQATIEALDSGPGELLAWLGPAIGPSVYEVGPEVAEAFAGCEAGLRPARRDGHWLLDLYTVARLKLQSAGVHAVHGGGLCTYSDPARFYSYRRDGETGRMASVIWLV